MCGRCKDDRGVCNWENAIVLGLTIIQLGPQQCACSSEVATIRRCHLREVSLHTLSPPSTLHNSPIPASNPMMMH